MGSQILGEQPCRAGSSWDLLTGHSSSVKPGLISRNSSRTASLGQDKKDLGAGEGFAGPGAALCPCSVCRDPRPEGHQQGQLSFAAPWLHFQWEKKQIGNTAGEHKHELVPLLTQLWCSQLQECGKVTPPAVTPPSAGNTAPGQPLLLLGAQSSSCL